MDPHADRTAPHRPAVPRPACAGLVRARGRQRSHPEARARGLRCGHGCRTCRPLCPGRRRSRGPAALSALPLPAGGATEPAAGADTTRCGAAGWRPAAPARRRDRRVSRATGGSARNAETAIGVAGPPRRATGLVDVRSGNTARTATRNPRCAATGSPRASRWARPTGWTAELTDTWLTAEEPARRLRPGARLVAGARRSGLRSSSSGAPAWRSKRAKQALARFLAKSLPAARAAPLLQWAALIEQPAARDSGADRATRRSRRAAGARATAGRALRARMPKRQPPLSRR